MIVCESKLQGTQSQDEKLDPAIQLGCQTKVQGQKSLPAVQKLLSQR